MPTRREIDDFLAQKRIAMVGVSRNPKRFSNIVYRALKEKGYEMYPVNPHAEMAEGDRCYPSVEQLPGPVDGAIVMLPPESTLEVMRGCAAAGIPRVWLGNGAVSPDAVKYGRGQGISVVDGACPMMFAEPVSFGHACHRFVKKITGSLPK